MRAYPWHILAMIGLAMVFARLLRLMLLPEGDYQLPLWLLRLVVAEDLLRLPYVGLALFTIAVAGLAWSRQRGRRSIGDGSSPSLEDASRGMGD